jgi:hypothetical protein
VHQLFLGFKKAYYSFSIGVLYNTLVEFVRPIEMENETKEFPKEGYSRVLLGKHLFALKYFLLGMVYK